MFTIKQTKKILDCFLSKNPRISQHELIKFCENIGYDKLNYHNHHDNGGTAKVLHNKKVIIKIDPNFDYSEDDEMPPNAVETKFCVSPKRTVLIQPKVKTDKKSVEKAMNNLDKNKELYNYDLHEGNVGIYKGKPVIFDW